MKTVLRSFLLIFTFLFFQFVELSAQGFNWVSGIPNAGGKAISTDAGGNSYVTGYFQGTASFGAIQLISHGGDDIYIAKYDPTGFCLWAKDCGGIYHDLGYGISVDANGNSYITGTFQDIASFGQFQLTSNGSWDIFIAKYDSLGNCLWAKNAGGAGDDESYAISVDPNGNSYITGSFSGTAMFGVTQLTCNASWEFYLAKYDPNGNCLWAKQASGTSKDCGYGISSDASGNSYVTGNFWTSATFGAFQLTSVGDQYLDIFTAKYDPSGNCLWAKSGGGIYHDYGSGISTDANGNSYVTGTYQENGTFSGTQLPNNGSYDIVLLKYDPIGNLVWAKNMGGSGDDEGSAVFVDAAGNSYLSGYFNGSAAFGKFQLTSYGGSDIYVAKYDPDGNCLFARNAGSPGTDQGTGISIDSKGNSYFTGIYGGTSTFGQLQLSGSGAFLGKISNSFINITAPYGNEIWKVGSSHNITWTSDNVTNVRIEFTTDNGSTWTAIIGSTPASSGSYSWIIPNLPSTICKVRISDAASSGIISMSNNVFTITTTDVPAISIVSPVGGEIWQTGSSHNITWTSTNIANVKVEFTTNNGGSWLTLTASTPASSGSYGWIVPNTPSNNCRIKISDPSNTAVNDESKNTFSISQFVFYARIQADTLWKDQDYDGLELGQVDGSGSYISTGAITSYNWYVNNQLVAQSVKPTIQLTTGTNLVKLVVTNQTNVSAIDSVFISVYSAKISTGGSILSGVSQFGNNFYVTSMNTGVYRIDSIGSVKQTYLTGGNIQSSLCISKPTGLLYVGSSDTRLYCFDSSLNSIWDKGLGGVVNASASVNYSGNIVYVGANNNNTNLGVLKSLVAPNGNPNWTFQADGTILSSPVVLEVVDSSNVVLRTIIYFGTSKGTVYAVEDLGTSYSLFWSLSTLPDSSIVSSPAISKDGMLYLGSRNGYLYRFTWDGSQQSTWKIYAGGPIASSPVIDENSQVFIASGDGHVYGYDKNFIYNSSPVKSFYQNYPINGTPGIGPDGTLLVGCDNGKFFALNKNISGVDMPVKWYFQASGPITAPTLVTDYGIVYIGSTDGDIYIMKDPSLTKSKMQSADFEWPTFKGDNQRSKVTRLVSTLSSINGEKIQVNNYSLYQNFPNPFNPSTIIKFAIPVKGNVKITIYNQLGEIVEVLADKEMEQGEYNINWSPKNISSGVYFYQIKINNFISTKKAIFIK